MNNDLLKLSEVRAAQETAGLICAIKFQKNKKRNFESVLAIGLKADLFLESEGQYLIGFAKTVPGARLAMAVLEEMRIFSWKFMLFANGRVQIKRYALRNMIDCFSDAAQLKDPTTHCHKVFDEPMHHFTEKGVFTFTIGSDGEREEEETSWRLPCRLLEGHLNYATKEDLKNPTREMQTVGNARLLCSCPYFDLSKFEAFPKPIKVEKAKKYWD